MLTLHLFDKKYCKNGNIVKNYYNLKSKDVLNRSKVSVRT